MDDKSLVYHYKHLLCVDSTNRYIKDEAANLALEAPQATAFVVTADNQTAGRGQRGNSWLSQCGENLLMSILVNPSFLKVSRQFALSQAVALAVQAAMADFGIDAILKWPNDIYVGKRKICGILVELSWEGDSLSEAIIGIGINVNQSQFPQMDKIPVSMKMLQGKEYSIDEVRNRVLHNFSEYYSLLQSGEEELIARKYVGSLLGYGEIMQYCDSEGYFSAAIEGVTPIGHLQLHCSDGSQKSYAFKEVELLL